MCARMRYILEGIHMLVCISMHVLSDSMQHIS